MYYLTTYAASAAATSSAYKSLNKNYRSGAIIVFAGFSGIVTIAHALAKVFCGMGLEYLLSTLR
jgi:ribulose 1,5-bisphosphate synthetase/thiazole synthase